MISSENGMEILENLDEWKKKYQSGFLATLNQTGRVDWQQYRPPINRHSVSGQAIQLTSSRLMLISSAGAYLHDSQATFDAGNPLGDFSIRVLPSGVELSSLAYAHEHYDHTAVDADPQVLIPLNHLRKLAMDGVLGGLTSIVSFMGYQPDVSRVIEETFPAILQQVEAEPPDAVLLVPS